jgi:hypothetical protein
MAMLADSVEVARRRQHPQAHRHRLSGGRGYRPDCGHPDRDCHSAEQAEQAAQVVDLGVWVGRTDYYANQAGMVLTGPPVAV